MVKQRKKRRNIGMIEERTKKILLAIQKHCNIIEDTEEHFEMTMKSLKKIRDISKCNINTSYANGELVKRLPDDFRKKHTETTRRNAKQE